MLKVKVNTSMERKKAEEISKVDWSLVPDGLVSPFHELLLIYWCFGDIATFTMVPRKRKYPVSSSFVEENALLGSGVRTGCSPQKGNTF